MKAKTLEEFDQWILERGEQRALEISNTTLMDLWTIAIYNSEEPAREIAFGYYEDFDDMLQDLQTIAETAKKEDANYTVFDFEVVIPEYVEVVL